MTLSRLKRHLRRTTEHRSTLAAEPQAQGLSRLLPPGSRRLLAVAAGLLVLSGCATTERQPFPAPPPPDLLPQQPSSHSDARQPAAPFRAELGGTSALSDSTAERRLGEPAVAVALPPAVTATALATPPASATLPQSTVIELIGTSSDTLPPLDALAGVPAVEPAQIGDLWSRIRAGFALPNLDGGLVRDHERWYASRPDYVQRMTGRGARYLHHVVEEVAKRHMPTELALLPFIESAFNPQADSVAKASGMWQFIPSTGRDFDLKQNVFRDDRRDVLASTRAALDYLEQLHGMFGDWHLALAAYNWGEGNVRKAITHNQRRGLPADYLSLRMPAETRNYLPKLQAVKNIISNPIAYGLALPTVDNQPYFVSVPIERDIDTALAARLAGLSLQEFEHLNPSMKKPVILAAGTPQILLPAENAEQFRTELPRYRGALASWTAWVVPRTMKPADAAEHVGMNEDELRQLNRIPARMLVKAGSTLLVPRSGHRDQDVSEHLADNAQIMLAPDSPPLKRRMVRAGKADTIATLARRFRVSPAQLASWNGLSAGSKVAAGRSLVIYVGTSGSAQKGVTVAGNHKLGSKARVTASRKVVARSRIASTRKPSVRIRRTASAAS
ncbi:MAG: transglycosylase SLT domain-containing protein [Leptothrix sp. (in: b-proteobacteria)]